MTDMKKFTKALTAIADTFTEPYEHTDREGVVTTRNRLGFLQDKLLNGLCYQLANALDYTSNRTLPEAKQAVARALRSHDGTEISELSLARAIDWIDRLNEQLALTQAALDEATKAYLEHTGKDFSYGRRVTANEDVAETPAMARARALGLANRTNVAADFNSNRGAA